MKFKNYGEDKKVRIAEIGGYRWMTARKNKIIDIPENVGILYKFEKVEEEKEVEQIREKKSVKNSKEPTKKKSKKSK